MKIKMLLLLVSTWMFVNGSDIEPWNIPYAIEGKWIITDEITGARKASVNLSVKRDTLYGVIESTLDKTIGDTCKNCRSSLKGKTYKGMRFMWGFIQKNNLWVKGRVVDLQNGKPYKAEIKVSEERDTLYVFSYVSFIVKVGRTQKWIKG